ncbi:SDR family NAD(P)-dependent oxidoreductase [Novosphingobium bradum]|uniref:SDR family NAD(P)-dependent oxidoreductase n=1 Tax=Novosphingobium bradum TaxID=1737444 RepID=A0ABV7IVY0_9SPHN
MARFDGKVALVTGAAAGIGGAIVRRLADEGARVVALDIDAAALVHDHPAVVNRVCDMTDRGQVDAMVAGVMAEFGRIDLLFNNAGIGMLEETPDIQDENWERVFRLNVTAVMYAARAIIPHMRAAGGGAIINTASISGLAGDYGHTAYNASKGAVIQYTRAMAIDHGKDNIRVNALCPGLILGTRMTGRISARAQEAWAEATPLGRGGTAEEMAAVAAFLASDDASYMTGSIVVADGGLTAHTGQPNMVKILREMAAQG